MWYENVRDLETLVSPQAASRIRRSLRMAKCLAGDVRSAYRFVRSAEPARWTGDLRALAELRDRHAGRRAFVIGNGPSLRVEDLDRLRDEVTFAANRVHLAFDRTAWRPTHYAVSDQLVLEADRAIIDGLSLPSMVFPDRARGLIRARPGVIFYPDGYDKFDESSRVEAIRFSTRAYLGLHGGFSVLYPLLQLAFHTGVREAYLIGVDHSWSIPKGRGGPTVYGQALVNADERNHFDPRYRGANEQWSMPRTRCVEMALARAHQVYSAHGGGVYNATRGGALEVLPRVDLDSLLA